MTKHEKTVRVEGGVLHADGWSTDRTEVVRWFADRLDTMFDPGRRDSAVSAIREVMAEHVDGRDSKLARHWRRRARTRRAGVEVVRAA